MSNHSDKGFSELRRRAEALVIPARSEVADLSTEQIGALLHDLQVHQIELEMQNEELREIQRDLEASRDRYSQLYNQAPVGYLTLNSSGIIIQTNPTFLDMLGLSPSELRMSAFSNYIDPRDRGVFFARFRAFFKSPTDKFMEIRLVVKDGAQLYARIEGRAVTMAPGNPDLNVDSNLLLIIVSDITELKQAEEALRAASTRMTEILESISDAFFSLDENLHVVYFNSAAERILGKDRAEVLGKEIFSVFPETKDSVFEENYRTALQEKRFIAFETYFDKPPYQNWYDVRIYPQAKGISVYFQVITERVKLEQQLRQAQKMEAVGQLAGGVAHYFNNLLQVVLGHAEMAMDLVQPANPVHGDLRKIREATDRAVGLIRQLLSFSRNQVMRPERVDLDGFIRKCMNTLQQTAGERIAIEFVPDEGVKTISVDPAQLGQVLINLTSNARGAMPQGGRIVIRTGKTHIDGEFCRRHPWAKRGDYITLSFADTGPGIPQELQGRIFEPFFTTRNTGEGPGLGLATVYGIVKQHEGLVDVGHAPGYGALFYVYLPELPDGASSVTHNLHNTDTAVSSVDGQASGSCILLAEEDDMVRGVAVRILARDGHRVLIARDCREFLALMKEHADDIDLIFLDAAILRKSGRTILDAIQSTVREIPVLLGIGYGFHQVDREFAGNNKFSVAPKPYEPQKLLHLVREALGKNEHAD